MRKKFDLFKLNKGFTLVELVVTVAILALVGTALITMIAVSSTVYKKQTAEVNLQYQSQMASGQLQDLILSANNGMRWDEANRALYLYSAEYDAAGTLIRKTTTITWNQDEKRLYLANENTAAPETLAMEVVDFDVAIYDKLGNMLATTVTEVDQPDGTKKEIHNYDDSMDAHNIVVRYSYDFDGRTYNETTSCTLRNTILVSSASDPDKFYQNVPSTGGDKVNAVIVSVPNISTNHLWVGENTGDYPFTTEVLGYNVTDHSFVWSFGQPYTDKNDGSAVISNDKGTSIDTATGKVTIGLTEYDNFNVIGTSKMSETLAAAGKGSPKSAAILFYPKYIVSANATSTNLASFDYIKDKELKYQVKVTVKNGLGTDVEKNQVAGTLSATVKDDRGVSIFAAGNNKYNSELGALTYTGGYSTSDSYTYIFEQILKNPPKDYSFVYTATCNGYNVSGANKISSSVSAILNKPYEYTRLQLMSTSGVNVFPGQKTMCRVYITKHYLVDNDLTDELIDVTDDANLSIEAGEDFATLGEDGLLVIKKGNDSAMADILDGKSVGPVKVTASYKDPIFGKNFVAERNFTVNPIEAYLVQKDGSSQVPKAAIMTAGSGETDLLFEMENAAKHPEKMSVAGVSVGMSSGGGAVDPGLLRASVTGGNKVVLYSENKIPVADGATLENELYPFKVVNVKVEWKGDYTNQLKSAPYNYKYMDTAFDTGLYETFDIMIGNPNVQNGPTPDKYTSVFVPGFAMKSLAPFDTTETELSGNGIYILDRGAQMHFDARYGSTPGTSKIVFYKGKGNSGAETLKSSTGGYFWKF